MHQHTGLRNPGTAARLLCIIGALTAASCEPKQTEAPQSLSEKAGLSDPLDDILKSEDVAALAAQHQARIFPPDRLRGRPLGYEIQEELSPAKRMPIICAAFLEDIFYDNGQLMAEFLVPLNSELWGAPIDKVRMRLRITPEQASEIEVLLSLKEELPTIGVYNPNEPVDRKKADAFLRMIDRHFGGPELLILAKTEEAKRTQVVEFEGRAYGDEVEIEPEIGSRYLTSGELLKILKKIE
jgi:hypothetical protein